MTKNTLADSLRSLLAIISSATVSYIKSPIAALNKSSILVAFTIGALTEPKEAPVFKNCGIATPRDKASLASSLYPGTLPTLSSNSLTR